MEAEKELTKLRERLFKKPNPFDWSKIPKGEYADQLRRDILKKPYPCDDCGDTYNKDNLIKHFGTKHLICKNCIDDYHRLYVEGKK